LVANHTPRVRSPTTCRPWTTAPPASRAS
jgi:hypothetical protein